MTTAQRYKAVVEWFVENVGEAESELKFRNPYELLVAVILSAQCTDKRVNMTTPALFEAYPDAESLSKTSAEDIFPYIKSISYPNSKANHLASLGKQLLERFGGEVPSELDELMSLPGVGRKTACVVSSIVYDKPVIAVDTHIFRVSHRIGLSKGSTPLAVEKDLEKHIPIEVRSKAHHWLILHGRYTCTAKRPHCEECGIREFCLYPEKPKK